MNRRNSLLRAFSCVPLTSVFASCYTADDGLGRSLWETGAMAMIPFRDLVAAHLASRHLPTDGWSVQRDLLLESGMEVHFLASRDQENLLAYCKEEAGNVLFEHVDHTAALAHEAGANSAVLYIPIGSFTPPIILAYAAKQHVRIEAL